MRFALGFAFLCWMAAAPAHAIAVYSYLGTPFTKISTDGQGSPSQPYSTSDRVYLTFFLAAPLAPNLNNQLIAPQVFVFTDGINIITNKDATSTDLRVSTDSSGRIVAWYLHAQKDVHGLSTNSIVSANITNAPVRDVVVQSRCFPSGTAPACLVAFNRPFQQAALNSGIPGSWLNPLALSPPAHNGGPVSH